MSEKRGFGDFVDRLTSVAAIITAVAAVGIAVYEAHITREQQKKSVWPYVMQGNSHSAGSGYLRYVENVGLGPALVRSFVIQVGDSTYTSSGYRSWFQVVPSFTGTDTTHFIYSDFGDGSVLKAGERMELLHISDGPSAARFAKHESELRTTACYCSLYGDCWIARSEEREPQAVASCDSAK